MTKLIEEMSTRKPLGFYDKLIESNVANGTFSLLEPGVTQISDPNDNTKTITYRHVTVFSPLTSVGELYSAHGVDKLVGVIMAIYHFNNRISRIVPQIAEIADTCDIRYSWEVADTERLSITAARFMLNEVIPRASDKASPEAATRYPTAVLGAYRSAVSAQLSVVTGLYNITQVSYGSASDQLDDKGRYPYFGRTIVGVGGIAYATTDWFRDALGASHVFCIYTRDVFGIDFYQAFQLRASELGIHTAAASLDSECSGDCLTVDIEKALDALERSGYQYVYAILSTSQYLEMMPMAYERSLAGLGNRFWLFDDTFVPQPNDPDSILLKASHGSAVLKFAEDALLANIPAYQEEWDQYMLTEGTRSMLRERFPEELRHLLDDYDIPASPSSTIFAYDAFMAVALASCHAQAEYGPLFTRANFHQAYLSSDFQGATNRVRFDAFTGTRAAETMTFHMGNYRSDEPPDENGQVTLTSYSTHEYVFDVETNSASWHPITNSTDFVFVDNSTEAPLALPPSEETVLEIDLWATIMTICFAVFLIGFVLIYCIWMHRHANALPISTTQPFFIWMLAIGVILMSFSLISGALLPYVQFPNVACMAIPWLLSVGFCVAFAALFSKLMRVGQLFRYSRAFVRVKVSPVDVLKPFVGLLSLNLIILLSYTIISPLEYTKESLDDYDEYGRPLSSFYVCNSPNAAPFRIALGALDILVVLITAHQAYGTRHVQIRYNESPHIFVALVLSSESFLIGIPGVIATRGNPSAELICKLLAVSWGCLALVLPIFLPKIHQLKDWEEEESEKRQSRQARVHNSQKAFEAMRRWNAVGQGGSTGVGVLGSACSDSNPLRSSFRQSSSMGSAPNHYSLGSSDTSTGPVDRTTRGVPFALSSVVDSRATMNAILEDEEEELSQPITLTKEA